MGSLRNLIGDANATFRYALPPVPDVTLLDVELPGTDAPGAIRALKRAAPAARIIGFRIVRTGRYHEECRCAGSQMQLLKDSPVEAIIVAIRAA